MRVIVPLQGVVRSRGGLVLGSLILCTLFYFFQLYLKSRHRSKSNSGDLSDVDAAAAIPGSQSRPHLSPRGSLAPANVSSRAAVVAGAKDSAFFAGMKRCAEDPYDPAENPDGVIQLGVAETKVSLDLIGDWLRRNVDRAFVDKRKGGLNIEGLAMYQPLDGLTDLKIGMVDFMGRIMGGSVTFNPSQIILTGGASAAIEALGFCLADPGNAFLVPSPYYPGFDMDIKLRTGVELIPVPCRSTDNFSWSAAALERAYKLAKKQGVKVRAILITNPSNPVGNILNEDKLYELLDFATEKSIHVIVDEIYAGSTYGMEQFVSMAQVLETQDYDKSRVHIVYGLSKDLSIPGFRVGAIYSYNENVLAAASKFAKFYSISVPTQQLLVSMLTDTKFITEYIEVNRERIRKSYTLFVDGLKQLSVDCVNSSGGFYCWVDMSKFIWPYSEKGELELWDKLLNVAKINVTPGSSCHCIEPGWFRCCFATLAESDIPVVMERIKTVIEG